MATHNLKDLKSYNNGFFTLNFSVIIDEDVVPGIFNYIIENLSNNKSLRLILKAEEFIVNTIADVTYSGDTIYIACGVQINEDATIGAFILFEISDEDVITRTEL